jgi:pimeloyl-ACP methyl ester carboxylesterase
VGVSFGALIASAYAAGHPHQIVALVLLSPPSPSGILDPETERSVGRPWTSLPRFAVRSIARLWPEVRAARTTWPARAAFTAGHLARVLRWPQSPARMAAWVREWQAANIPAACQAVTTPTLIIVGDSHLDRVVPVAHSAEYLALIPHATMTTIPGTGHLSFLSKPREVAAVIRSFVDRSAGATSRETLPA